jgi:hypothetical protein
MTNKTDLWDRLGKTDPSHTKQFKRSGGFSGTAIKPMWSYRRMTEEYGPCGEGWGVNEPSFQVVPGPEGEVLVYCTVSIWHGERDRTVFGVGGDKVVGKNKYGLSGDDEAFKKAFTDAVTNALKLIGVGADVHMGLFDDSKYVNERKQDEARKDAPAADNESRIAYIAQCRETIRKSTNAEKLANWWKDQKQARLDFELTQAEVSELKDFLIARHNQLTDKKEAA